MIPYKLMQINVLMKKTVAHQHRKYEDIDSKNLFREIRVLNILDKKFFLLVLYKINAHVHQNSNHILKKLRKF